MFDTECPEIQYGALNSYNLKTIHVFIIKKGGRGELHLIL
jgi:hypothetical protein